MSVVKYCRVSGLVQWLLHAMIARNKSPVHDGIKPETVKSGPKTG